MFASFWEEKSENLHTEELAFFNGNAGNSVTAHTQYTASSLCTADTPAHVSEAACCSLHLKEMALGHGGTGVCFISALCTIHYEETAWAQQDNEYPCLLNAH